MSLLEKKYIFLDFETGTTVDNSYAITGIKHDLTPGKFTTQLTLSYGDVYGKYENAAKTIARTPITRCFLEIAVNPPNIATIKNEIPIIIRITYKNIGTDCV